jgi:Ran GTPase-activating protein (RanGAP) involved in mRNA processing and transport
LVARVGSKLVKIDLKDNTLGEIGGKALAKVLRNHPNLKHVILSETAIGNKGAIALVKALSETAPHLEVGHKNKITTLLRVFGPKGGSRSKTIRSPPRD